MATKRKVPAVAKSAPPAATARASNEPPIDGGRSPEEIVLLAEKTVNGIPLSALPAHIARLIHYSMTDQGIEESNAKKLDSQGRPHSGVKITMNEGFDQSIAKRAAAMEPWECEDPLVVAKQQFGRPGFTNRGLSPTVIGKRTLRGWQIVNDPKTGQPVKIGNLLLGEMPIEMAARRNEHYRKLGQTELAASVQRLKVDQERLAHDARSKGFEVGPLRDGDALVDHYDPDRHGSIGVHTQRGIDGADAAL